MVAFWCQVCGKGKAWKKVSLRNHTHRHTAGPWGWGRGEGSRVLTAAPSLWFPVVSNCCGGGWLSTQLPRNPSDVSSQGFPCMVKCVNSEAEADWPFQCLQGRRALPPPATKQAPGAEARPEPPATPSTRRCPVLFTWVPGPGLPETFV